MQSMLLKLSDRSKPHLIDMGKKLCKTLELGMNAKRPAYFNTNQCLVILAIANGENVTYAEHRHLLNSLCYNGYVAKELSDQRGTNHRPLNRYWLTGKGQAAHAEIIEKFTPVLERVNHKLQTL